MGSTRSETILQIVNLWHWVIFLTWLPRHWNTYDEMQSEQEWLTTIIHYAAVVLVRWLTRRQWGYTSRLP